MTRGGIKDRTDPADVLPNLNCDDSRDADRHAHRDRDRLLAALALGLDNAGKRRDKRAATLGYLKRGKP